MAAIQGRLTFLRVRRLLALSFTLSLVVVAWLALEQVRRWLGDPAMASGWTLLVSTLGLYGLGMRKRAIARSLGPVAAWLQVHTYLGLFATVVFVMHVDWPIRGQFELAMAAMFLFISLSGAVLLWHSRRVPKLLAVVKRDYRFEDIPQIQADLAAEAHATVLQSANTGAGATLAEYYQRRLLNYFHSPRSWLYRCLPTGTRRRQLLRELEDLDRYLDSSSLVFRQKLSSLVISKDDTDFHHAMQQRLRWLVASHVALTWSLLLMIAVHIVLVLRFQGAMV
ncbi:MAG: hypothetical protein IT423_19125 [Pirellulaceae bacterium]|nr:hypothetical protein [Pirellulaceae bacterium]